MYLSPEVRDLGEVQALTLAGSTVSGTVGATKSNTASADTFLGYLITGYPTGSNCVINGGPLNGLPC